MSRPCFCASLVLALLSLPAPSVMGQASATWKSTTSGDKWTNDNNWLSQTQASGVDQTANFGNLNILADTIVDLDGNITIGHLIYGDTTPSHNWTLSGTGVLTLDVTAGSPTITVNNQSTTIAVGLSGSDGFTKAGSGTLLLTGANNYTGGTSISNGTLSVSSLANGGVNSNIGSSTSAASNLVINGGTLRYTGSGSSTNRQFTLGTSGGTIDSSGSGVVSFTDTSAVTLSGTNAARTLTLTGSNGNGTSFNSIAASIGDNGAGATSLVKSGNGSWLLSGNNSFSGVTTINSGILVVGSNNALGSTNGGTVVNSSGQLRLLSGVSVGNEALSINGTGGSTAGALRTDSGSSSYQGKITLAGDASIFAASGTSLTLDVASGDAVDLTSRNLTFDGAGTIRVNDGITGSGSIIRNSTGTLILSGANSYTGGTTVSSGTLQLGNGGTGGSLSTSSTISVATGATFSVNQSDTVTQGTDFSGSAISGAGGFTQAGSGTTVLTAANTYTGATNVSSGTLQLGNGGTGGSLSTSSAISVASGGVFSVNQSDTVTQGTDFSGSAITGQGGVTQAGSGTTILTAANSYTGATNVNAGTLRINGNQIAATGNVTVSSGATLGGSGTIGGATTISGIHSPGNSPGLQTFNGGLTYLNGSSLTWELADNTIGGRGTLFDGIDVTGGTLTINSGVTSNLVFNASGSLVDWSNSFWAISRQWLVYDNANAPTLGDPIFTTIGVSNDKDGDSLASARDGSFFSWSKVGNDIFLNYTFAAAAVPEPGTFGLMGLVGLVGVLRHRRQRKKMSQV